MPNLQEVTTGFIDWLANVIDQKQKLLIDAQYPEGYWVFEVESDCTIPSLYIFLCHYLGEWDEETERKIRRYLHSLQAVDGGWPLFYGGESDLSATVQAYYALKLIGDSPSDSHMQAARRLILSKGGVERVNVLTRYLLALFNQMEWKALPGMMIECVLFPKWLFFNLYKISYWSRLSIVTLLMLTVLKPHAKNPKRIDITELFVSYDKSPPLVNPTGSVLGNLFLRLDRVIRFIDPFSPPSIRRYALKRAENFIIDRLNGDDGLGAIFPPTVFAHIIFHELGYPPDHPYISNTRAAIVKLMFSRSDGGINCQPCLSPIWDTGFAAYALLEISEDSQALNDSLRWLQNKQILDCVGDWSRGCTSPPRPGGWAFEFNNPYYPDLDDTALIGMVLERSKNIEFRDGIDRAVEWVLGMQSDNGGWGAFDRNNTFAYLDNIPFADHGALRDPPTEDVTARCLSFLVQAGIPKDDPRIKKGLAFLFKTQKADGSWYGRWGVNYIYGTWSVLSAFKILGISPRDLSVQRAIHWLLESQNQDGGWSEDCATYHATSKTIPSTPSQTAWALLGLMAGGEIENLATKRGVEFLLNHATETLRWPEDHYTGVGFPRVFYLKYWGYSIYFPLLALARYYNLINEKKEVYGI